MDIPKLVSDYLHGGKTRMMQLATSRDGQPWCCTVYYALDDDLNIIWASLPTRRHSEDIAANPKVAGAIAFDQQPPQASVRGIQFEGIAELLSGDDETAAANHYVEQLNRKDDMLSDIRAGKNPHRFYKLTVKSYILFDSANFPDNPRQEWSRT